MRAKKINELRKTKSPDPYPHKFHTTMTIPDFVGKYAYLGRGELLQGIEVAMAGRIMVQRGPSKLKFYEFSGDVRTLWRFIMVGGQGANHGAVSVCEASG
jgi:lysyl-tRNA synthetase, class II